MEFEITYTMKTPRPLVEQDIEDFASEIARIAGAEGHILSNESFEVKEVKEVEE